ncbi:MAG: hypothetical protein ACLRWQ_02625 [Flavonifractor plautii]
MKYLRSFYKRHRGMAALALLLLLGQVVGTCSSRPRLPTWWTRAFCLGIWMPFLRTGGQMLAVVCCRRRAVPGAGDRRSGRPLRF